MTVTAADVTAAELMPVEVTPVEDAGSWLVAHRWEMDRGEAVWLMALADFDRDGLYGIDGQLSCVDWLVLRTSMARPTAYDKLRIARQLRSRPLLADAFADGRLSYSALRAITRMDEPDPDVDAALIDVAAAGTISDVEHAVRYYRLHREQHRPPANLDDRRQLRIAPGYDGTTRVEITVSSVEGEELAAALQAFVDHPASDYSAEDSPSAEQAPPVDDRDSGSESADDVDMDGAVDYSAEYSAPTPDTAPGETAPDETAPGDTAACGTQTGPSRRADAFMDLVRTALAHVADGHAVGADRYVVHIVAHDDRTAELADGTPLDETSTETVRCDSSTVTHTHAATGELLSLGRKPREWSNAQRRAVLIRDGGHCRFPGCARRIADLHHQRPWSDGGPTDIDNALLACPRHHRLLHTGYHVTGNPNATLTFSRPDRTVIGITTPTRRHHPTPLKPGYPASVRRCEASPKPLEDSST